MSRKNILLVDDRENLAAPLQEFLEQRGLQYAVIKASSHAEALHIIRGTQVDLMVGPHLGEGEGDGLALLNEIKALDKPTRTVLITEPIFEKDRSAVLSAGCESLVVKPYSVEQLCSLIADSLRPAQGFRGRVIGMKLEDLIQMFCYRRDSTLLTVFTPTDRGTLYIHDGEIIHAECDSLTGLDAVCEILRWENGEFLSQLILTIPERTVYVDWQSALMEGIRERDEIRHALGPATAVPVSYEALTDSSASVPADLDGVSSAEDTRPVKRIMIVDDSRFIRKIVHEIVQADPHLSVVGYANNGQEALEKIDELKPDLILLDWDMPVMKGSTTLMHIMIRSPCPVIILSGFVGGVGANPFDLLCLGAVDFCRKPQNNWRTDGRADDLVRRIKQACDIRFDKIRRIKTPRIIEPPKLEVGERPHAGRLGVIVSSTGGGADLIRIVPSLPPDIPCAVLCVHDMQKEAIGSFVDYLDNRSVISVRQAESHVVLEQGVCYLHTSATSLELNEQTGRIFLRIPVEGSYEKTLDRLLKSAARVLKDDLVTAVLSGNDDDGISGMMAVREAGGATMVQDPDAGSFPKLAELAVRAGVVDHICPAEKVAETFGRLVTRS
jgi:two-component system, chemotaxis family, protein-glutamate methylesterase/glutaminase